MEHNPRPLPPQPARQRVEESPPFQNRSPRCARNPRYAAKGRGGQDPGGVFVFLRLLTERR